MLYDTGSIDNDNDARKESAHGSIGHFYMIIVSEIFRPEIRECNNTIDAFGSTKAPHGKREIFGNTEYSSVGESSRSSIELAYRLGTGAGVDAGENIQHDRLAAKALQCNVIQFIIGKRKVGCLCSDGW